MKSFSVTQLITTILILGITAVMTVSTIYTYGEEILEDLHSIDKPGDADEAKEAIAEIESAFETNISAEKILLTHMHICRF